MQGVTHNIEDKEIRGVTGRLIRTLLIGYTTIILGGAAGVYTIKLQLHDLTNNNNSVNTLQDTKIQELQIQINQVRLDQQATSIRVEQNTIDMSALKEWYKSHSR